MTAKKNAVANGQRQKWGNGENKQNKGTNGEWQELEYIVYVWHIKHKYKTGSQQQKFAECTRVDCGRRRREI